MARGEVGKPIARDTSARAAREPFGVTSDGVTVEAFTIANRSGVELRAMAYGAAILSIRAPDRDGRIDDVVLGYDDLAGYLGDSAYMGVVVGRYGNRIARGRFTLDGVDCRLSTNDGVNHLHGGNRGFDKLVWRGSPFEEDDSPGVAFSLTSNDGDEGYPGRLDAEVRYRLTDHSQLIVDYWAVADRPTIVNLTQHSYFNLAGPTAVDVLSHEILIRSEEFVPVDADLIPTGDIAPVQGTPFDFRSATRLGSRLDVADEQLRHAGGYDHTFVLAASSGAIAHAASVHDPSSGRTLDIFTTEPGLQLYSGNFLDGSIRGKGGRRYGHRSGLCLETQHFPDSPNHPAFPSTVLRPGEEYRSRTIFEFGVRPRG